LLVYRTTLRPTACWVRKNGMGMVAAQFEVLHRHWPGGTEETLGQGSVCSGNFPETGQQIQSDVASWWCNRPYSRASKPRVTHVTRTGLMQQVYPPPPPNRFQQRADGEVACLLQLIGNEKEHVICLNTKTDIESTYTKTSKQDLEHICCNSDYAEFR
jgi:hypothetical protein